MTKKITKNNKPVRKFSNEEAKKIAIHSVMSSITSDNAITEFAEKQLPSIREGETAKDKVSENINNISLAYSQESGHALIESVEPRYRGFALKLRDDLKKEFDCKTASEIALVDQIVNSHIRKISNAKLLESYNEPEWLSHEKVSLLNFFSRETDRAHRQFLSALETLKMMKQPSLKVNVKTNNAFISEKQQFNNNLQKNENNESK